ncbi:MAG: pilus assembly protein [Planctomycetes bacterium]|nr:pilus assembly protein [Planctomycetota bacterium]
MRRITRNRNMRRGTTAVELAMVAPVLLLMMLGAIEGGYGFMVKQTVSLAANRAARQATLPGSTSEDVNNMVDEVMSHAGLTGYEVNTNIDELDANDKQVTVEVSIPLHRALFTGSLIGGESYTISSKKVSNREMDPNLPPD